MKQMIVVDLDGTILDDTRYVTDKTAKYLESLKNKGYIIVIATGRAYDSAIEAAKGARFANYMITNTGAYLYSLDTGKILFKSNLKKKIVKKIMNKYGDRLDLIYLYTEKKPYKDTPIRDVKRITQAVFTSKYDIDKIYQELLKENYKADIIIMQNSFSLEKKIEVHPLNSSKYDTIKRLADKLGIDNKDIIAFGDGLNDIEMVSSCGHGVALKNALPAVKEGAKDITKDTNVNDGVMKYLMEYLP